MQLFKLVLSQSRLQNVKSYREVPGGFLFAKFVDFIHQNMCCNFLAKKIKTWLTWLTVDVLLFLNRKLGLYATISMQNSFLYKII